MNNSLKIFMFAILFILSPWIFGTIVDMIIFLRFESPLNWPVEARIMALVVSCLVLFVLLIDSIRESVMVNHKEIDMPFFTRKPKISVTVNDTGLKEGFRVIVKNHDDELFSNYYSAKDLNAYKILLQKTQSNTVSIYYILGMTPSTNIEDVKKAYRRMVMVYHPDHGGTVELFNNLVQAKDKALAKCK